MSVDNNMKAFGKDVAKIWEAWGGDRKAFLMKKGERDNIIVPFEFLFPVHSWLKIWP